MRVEVKGGCEGRGQGRMRGEGPREDAREGAKGGCEGRTLAWRVVSLSSSTRRQLAASAGPPAVTLPSEPDSFLAPCEIGGDRGEFGGDAFSTREMAREMARESAHGGWRGGVARGVGGGCARGGMAHLVVFLFLGGLEHLEQGRARLRRDDALADGGVAEGEVAEGGGGLLLSGGGASKGKKHHERQHGARVGDEVLVVRCVGDEVHDRARRLLLA